MEENYSDTEHISNIILINTHILITFYSCWKEKR